MLIYYLILKMILLLITFFHYYIFRFLNSEELSAEDEAAFTVDDDGVDTLIFEYINRTRAGEYMCSVVNTEGEGLSEPVMIDVLCK